MPPPPPPPPMRPPPGAPDIKNFKLPTSKSSDTGALLKDIRQGISLKKTVTVDKSGPFIPGTKTATNNNNNNKVGNRSPPNLTSSPAPPITNNGGGGINFDDILAISLRKTGRRPVDNNEDVKSNRNNGVSQIQDALRKQVPPRGPPPQPPGNSTMLASSTSKPVVNETKPVVNRLSTSKLSQITLKKRVDTVDTPLTLSTPNIPNAIPNNSSLHGNNNPSTNQTTTQKVTSHGKPNVAPKPPGVKPVPPPKNNLNGSRPAVNRTQSMRVPRSPGAQTTPPQFTLPINGNNEFTLRSNTSTLHQSNEALNRRNLTPIKNATLPLAPSRPTQPPPLRPPATKPPPPPPLRTPTSSSITVPQSPPPPPPPSLVNATRQPPPPPIHARVAPPPPGQSRLGGLPPPPPSPYFGGGAPPVPPVRGSSMRNGSQSTPQQEFDNRYIFHALSEFPPPDVFRRFHKEYSSSQGASKQQAPLPPSTTLQLGEKLWPSGDSSTC